MTTYLDFEKPIAELESKIAELRHLPNSGDVDIAEEVMRLQDRVQKQLRATYAKLTPWQRVQVARHAERPHAQRYIDRLITDYMPLAGDRAFGEDAAVVGGVGRLGGRSVVVLGQEKGDDTDSRIKHNFGMARPEGYRKAQRLMKLADRFGCRWSPWSTRRAPIPASMPRRAARPRPSPARSTPACRSACRWSAW